MGKRRASRKDGRFGFQYTYRVRGSLRGEGLKARPRKPRQYNRFMLPTTVPNADGPCGLKWLSNAVSRKMWIVCLNAAPSGPRSSVASRSSSRSRASKARAQNFKRDQKPEIDWVL